MPSLDLHPGITKVVVGFFDPVTSAHAARLQELASGERSLAVVVADPPQPLLSRDARAELVAALSVVDQVLVTDNADAFSLEGVEIVHEEAADERRRHALIRHIHTRQSAGKT